MVVMMVVVEIVMGDGDSGSDGDGVEIAVMMGMGMVEMAKHWRLTKCVCVCVIPQPIVVQTLHEPNLQSRCSYGSALQSRLPMSNALVHSFEREWPNLAPETSYWHEAIIIA